MPAFAIDSSRQLADFLIPVTPEMATEILALAAKADDGTAYAAVYYKVGTPEQNHRASIAIMVTLEMSESLFAYVRTDEYHPRKHGKADVIYKTDTLIRWGE